MVRARREGPAVLRRGGGGEGRAELALRDGRRGRRSVGGGGGRVRPSPSREGSGFPP